MTKIDELIGDIIALGTDHSNNPPAPQNEDEAKSALYDLILKEVVGEDETFTGGEFTITKQIKEELNALKAEQVKKLKELFDGK